MQSVQNNYCNCIERREKENSSSYRGYKLLVSEDWFEVVRVDCGIASIPLFKINVLLSSESIWFDAKTTRTEPDDKVELREILGLPYLSLGQYLGSGKILKVFMVHNNIDEIGQTSRQCCQILKASKIASSSLSYVLQFNSAVMKVWE